ncbi:unnamed protein product [Paramecium primaurelia]|uniref:Uncharacterized protein n=1 Tax=Paramecium primaurelia TaxID=5886 RepID=A0A8S1N4C6_PARPR|nr:unnamed protein product [Paramecium primaurelia]
MLTSDIYILFYRFMRPSILFQLYQIQNNHIFKTLDKNKGPNLLYD